MTQDAYFPQHHDSPCLLMVLRKGHTPTQNPHRLIPPDSSLTRLPTHTRCGAATMGYIRPVVYVDIPHFLPPVSITLVAIQQNKRSSYLRSHHTPEHFRSETFY